MDCNRNSDGIFWFNADDEDSTDETTLYRGDFDGDDDPEIIIDELRNPRCLICDDDDDKLYYFIGRDLYRYDRDNDDDYVYTGLMRANLGHWDSYFWW